MQLSERLTCVANFVTPNNKVADVGCDHAYTSIYLIEQKISPYVIAMDVNQGPIERAKENIKKYGYEKQIDVRRSDGLEKLKVDEVDTVLIAGMGGGLMVRILSEHLEVVSKVKELVLQPQSEVYRVRSMLKENGFIITNENMMIEDGKYYVMIKANTKEMVDQKENYEMSEEEHLYFGRLLLEQKHPILYDYLKKEQKQYETIYQDLHTELTEKSIQRKREMNEKLELINKGLNYYLR